MGNTCQCKSDEVIVQSTIEKKQKYVSSSALDHETSQQASFFINDKNQRSFQLHQVMFVEQKLLGSGSFSDVYLYQNTSTMKLNALKILKDDNTKEALLHEYRIMKAVESQFIIQLEDFIEIDGKFCILMEYANQGTLDHFVERIQNKSVNVSPSQLLDLICDIFSGLHVMHTKRIIHRDLKMENLLVSNFQIKIADFGVATYLIKQSYAQTKVGNMLFASPEKMYEDYNQSSDIYSAGLIILIIVLGISESKMLKLKLNNDFPNQLKDTPENLKDFLLSLLNKNPKERPSAIEAFNQVRMLKFDQKVLEYLEYRISGVEKAANTQTSFFSNQIQTLDSLNKISVQPIQKQSDEQKIDQFFQLGMKYLWSMQIAIAEYYFAQILEINPISIQGLAGQILCDINYLQYINKKDITINTVKEKLELAKNINPNDYLIYFCEGVLNNSIESLDKCIQLNPSMVEAIVVKSLLLITQNKKIEAIQIAQQALEKSENNVYVFRIVGQVYSFIDLETSLKYYLKSLEIDSNNFVVLFLLYDIYKKSNKFFESIYYLDKSHEINPYYKPTIMGKIAEMLYQYQYQEVIQYIISLFSQYGEIPELLDSLATAYMQINDNENALLNYQKFLLIDQKDPIYLHNIGIVYLRMGLVEKSKEFLLKAIAQQFKYSYISMYEILISKNLYEQQEAEDYLHQLLGLEFDQTNEGECMLKLQAHFLLNQIEEFLTFAEVAVTHHPKSHQISGYILNKIKESWMQKNINQQFKVSEMISKQQGTKMENLQCSIKYLKNNDMSSLIGQYISQYLYGIVISQSFFASDYDLLFQLSQFCEKYEVITTAQALYYQNKNNLFCQYFYVQSVILQDDDDLIDKFELQSISNDLLYQPTNDLNQFLNLMISQLYFFSDIHNGFIEKSQEAQQLRDLVALYESQGFGIRLDSLVYYNNFNNLSVKVKDYLKYQEPNEQYDFFFQFEEKLLAERNLYHPNAQFL